jgi:SAM-dependent methyltransferase
MPSAIEKITQIPVEYLVCPVSKQPLRPEEDMLISPEGRRYRFVDGFYWSFMPEIDIEKSPGWKMWKQLQQNGEVAYPNDPEHNLGVNARADYIDFGDFCDFRGLVLDIGSGPQRMPTHFKYCGRPGATFFGIDPLVGEQPRDYHFVHGLGEYLPFRGNLFDQVLFVTSLDHFINPVEALVEAGRVIRDDGEICVWIGEKDKTIPPPRESPDWYYRLTVPDGAEDPFHIKRFTIDEFREYVVDAGLIIKEERIIAAGEYRRNGFFKLEKRVGE